ncbi:CsbD family protein [Actinocorallia longicatena]|uniref:CsbD family protein n=1 Tax=Actinocorallia longicatena TaxID=111803 RepID=A0ABP6Q7J8_9ACTN
MGDLEGKANELKGKGKEALGKMTGDDELQGEGKGDQVKGQAQQATEKVKDAVGDAADKVKGMFKRD